METTSENQTARVSVRTQFCVGDADPNHRIPAPKGRVCESPARKCRVEVGSENESCRDGTISLAISASFPPEAGIPYNALIFDKNSPFVFVLLNLSISNSIASTGDSGFSTFRSTHIRDKSSRGISNSSFRVPER